MWWFLRGDCGGCLVLGSVIDIQYDLGFLMSKETRISIQTYRTLRLLIWPRQQPCARLNRHDVVGLLSRCVRNVLANYRSCIQAAMKRCATYQNMFILRQWCLILVIRGLFSYERGVTTKISEHLAYKAST